MLNSTVVQTFQFACQIKTFIYLSVSFFFNRVTKPIFMPPLKLSSSVSRQASNVPKSQATDHDSGFLDGSQYESPAVHSPRRAVAAVTPSTRKTPASFTRTNIQEDIDTPHYPLCLTGT